MCLNISQAIKLHGKYVVDIYIVGNNNTKMPALTIFIST
jgi:hypothetical protein